MNLRDYQIKAYESLRYSVSKGAKRIVLMAPTAFGKTVLAAHIAQQAHSKNKRVWFIADTIELVEQALAKFEDAGLDCGVIQGIHEKTDYSKMVQVATPQTLAARLDKQFADRHEWMPDLVLVDECHQQYSSHKKLMDRLPDAVFIGLSATPFSKGLGKPYQELIVTTNTKHLTDEGFLVPVQAYAAKEKVDLKGVKTSKGDWQEKDLEERVSQKAIIGDIVSNWKRYGENRQTLVFCVNVAHSKKVAQEFALSGISVAHIDGKTDKEERATLIKHYRNGEIKVLCSVGVLTKGFDAPSTGCVVLARPTKSLMLHIQMLGRGLRIADGKEDCIILDHAGNIERNGFPDDPLPTELCDGNPKSPSKDRKQKDEPLPKECPKCGCIKPALSTECWKCGYTPERQSDVETLEGEMQSLKKANRTTSKEDKQKFFSGLVAYGISKGHQFGWATNMYKEKFGVYPNAYKRTSGEITKEVENWVTYQKIKWANRRGSKQ